MTFDHDMIQSLLVAYALDATDADEALAVEAHLDQCAACASSWTQLHETVELLATMPDAVPHPAMRSQGVAAALARRATRPDHFAPADLHLIESARSVDLLAGLPPADWRTPIGPALPDWTVQDVVAHLAATEALLAEVLGVEPFTPETEDQPTPRATPAVARHRRLSPARTLVELELAFAHVHTALDELSTSAADRSLSWTGLELSLAQVLIQRSFEIWTHADDIRAAVGLPLLAPPARSLTAMSAMGAELLPILSAAAGIRGEGRRVAITLTGRGGAAYQIDLDLDPSPVGDDPHTALEPDTALDPDTTLELDLVDFCRGLADRLPAADIPYQSTGDQDLAAALMASLPGLAML